ncbi:MAG TPA: hypothetical protein VHN74_08190 [Candidatus Angelobacter sp.]|jgi:hypothetical protein|nr:hypothetical protein [Candidatus Angelobacter sp.]
MNSGARTDVDFKEPAERNSFGGSPRFRLSRVPWLSSLIFFGIFLAISEGGMWLGERSQLTADQARAQIIAVEESVLAILALLLAFSLVMAVSRFDSRRQLAVEEANAIATAYWRCLLVPPPQGRELIRLIQKYLDAKVHFFDAGVGLESLRASRERTAQLQNEMWSRAAANSLTNPQSVPAGLLLESFNHAFDLEDARWTTLTVHVPAGVLWVDCLIGLLAGLLVGYNFGLSGHRDHVSTWVLATCVSTVLAVIMDLDQPRRGLIAVGAQPLIDLQRRLARMQ